MRPADHPEFFRFPPPAGRSRESTIRLDARGRFWHEGAPVEHSGLAAALPKWITRHPDDGRFILSNGYDWTYFQVDDAPFFVRHVVTHADFVELHLSDDTVEPWDPTRSRIGDDGALYTFVKHDAERGPFEAKFTPHAQAALAPVLVEGDGGRPAIRLQSRTIAIGGA